MEMKIRKYLFYIEALAILLGFPVLLLFGQDPIEKFPVYCMGWFAAMALTTGTTTKEEFFSYLDEQIYDEPDDEEEGWDDDFYPEEELDEDWLNDEEVLTHSHRSA